MTTAAQSKDSRPTVLVVDDDEGLRLVTRKSLETQGFRVIDAENGRDAIRLFEERGADIVLLDIMMPDMDGFAVCSALRGKPEGKHTAIVMITGLDDAESIRFSYHLGATDFITKPINYALLEYRLHYLLRAKKTADALRKMKRRLTNAQRIARIGYWEWDAQTGSVNCSENLRAMFGVPSTVTLDTLRDYLERVHPDDRRKSAGVLEDACLNGTAYQIEHRVTLRDQSQRVVFQEGEFQRLLDGTLHYAAGTIHDITARRETERSRNGASRAGRSNATAGRLSSLFPWTTTAVGKLGSTFSRLFSHDGKSRESAKNETIGS